MSIEQIVDDKYYELAKTNIQELATTEHLSFNKKKLANLNTYLTKDNAKEINNLVHSMKCKAILADDRKFSIMMLKIFGSVLIFGLSLNCATHIFSKIFGNCTFIKHTYIKKTLCMTRSISMGISLFGFCTVMAIMH